MNIWRSNLRLALALVWGCGGATYIKPPEAPPEEDTEDAGESIVMAFSADMDEQEMPEPDDADEDGFSDDIDLCPTLHAVSEDGCPAHVKMNESRSDLLLEPEISFKLRTAELRPDSETGLEELRMVMDRNRDLRIRIEAHTFDRRDAATNMTLSTQRAAEVRNWLVSRGIALARLEVYGCGKNRPRVAVNGRNRSANRRVELHVLHPLPPSGYPSTLRCEEVLPPAAAEALARAAGAGAVMITDEHAAPLPEPVKPAMPMRAATAEPTRQTAPTPAATPGPTAAAPAPPDADSDGLPDASDRCPRTPGLRSLHGCAKRHRLELDSGHITLLRHLHFLKANHALKPRSATLLAELAATLEANPSLHVRLEVRELGQALAVGRAASIRRWLTEHGIDAARVQAAGCTRDPGSVTVSAAESRDRLAPLPADCASAAP